MTLSVQRVPVLLPARTRACMLACMVRVCVHACVRASVCLFVRVCLFVCITPVFPQTAESWNNFLAQTSEPLKLAPGRRWLNWITKRHGLEQHAL